MTIEEIQNFVFTACGKSIPVCFVDTNLEAWKFLSEFPAWVSPKNNIVINKIIWDQCDDLIQRYLILHELGHIEDPSNYFSSVVQRELFAQVYAINKAKTLKMHDLADMMKFILSSWEFQFKWNSPHRKYILASRLAKKKGIVL